MKYFFYSLAFLFTNTCSLNAQQFQGFSKLYKSLNDTIATAEIVMDITYDSLYQNFFFCSSSFVNNNGTFFATFYKTDMQGNVLTEVKDSVLNGNIQYQSVEQSKDGRYLYWGGSSDIKGHADSIKWVLRKTDKNLNTIWYKQYSLDTMGAYNYNIKAIGDSGNIMQLCFKYRPSVNDYNLPEAPSKIYMRKIDSNGNLLAEYAPVNWPYTDAYGLEFTDDGGYMINGTNNNKGYILKTDSACQEVFSQHFTSDATASAFNNMCKQNGNEENYFNAGTVTVNANYDAIGFASKTDGNGTEVWQKRISKNGVADEFYGIANGRNLSSVFVGATYLPDIQYSRGWMVKLDDNGNEIWNKMYTTLHSDNYDDYIYRVLPMPDGGFLAAGSTFGQEANGRWSQYGWLLRVDSNGCYNPECSSFTAITTVKAPKETIDVFPNPSSGMFHLIKSTPFPKNTTVTLIDATGKTLKELESPSGKTQMVYNLKGTLLPGVYFLKIDMGNEVLQKKVVISF